ncbi:bifunctional diaminohydroxyphosphoribosylaminopyrimidine deaminase/5-amino-6-(5-phosphoribosylamino)uracil reductase [Rhizobium sp. Leaf384]|uniref:bifunctional diaminohydroxyphosphoribosylaminopyrimidine deaminase/5-amino-6-(5-phosphoribosylamino)uracil reductase RibD n=1 Tax=unclassified Rhizobium TaxID=2613769 RepID=UPI0007149925|nr:MULTISPECIES: bifunctional diaminohydroxyphosphoribosylaminopyrimidine deaminase/5-amino-6-(5-phosphoribosylamino)uracil reductase RibD [unclassified Rhizobium]KQR73521.1 bifunctional diaminohydroxyphosphoribosylaminopyrimidine deaminase/5-amino-6-(5-phosphoribosylamino)uracil reductase [Rhizobium sp. Leaf341]KQS81483.1 bifunctional diaminohydroxyphosphoribosylaminopyrimidine deaminase/5-amino-6-(5-phosphoribosylamino)uracil reductase [Rhizobium sp. Leaf384]KQS86608.1 bifunctional diaminohydr
MAADGIAVSAGVPVDEQLMADAIAVGAGHLGFTGSNPSVGCLIVQEEAHGPRIIAAAVTAPGGRPHAETQALAQAGEAARGATAYVTLEPCSHHGHTPPCAEALIRSGVSRVVISVVDPDPRVSGRGIAMLQEAGIVVETGVLASQGTRALEAYLMRMRLGRPHVTLKLALSRDGMIGDRARGAGQGQVAITGPEARTYVQHLRARTDAILVGIGTALADDPDLTVRLPGLEERSPVRIVLDADLRLPPDSKLARSARQVPVIAVARPLASEEDNAETHARQLRIDALSAQGVEVLEGDPRRLDLLLPALASRGLSSLLVEGGARTAASFLAAGLVDRLLLFTGTPTIGPQGVASPVRPGLVPAQFLHMSGEAFGPDHLDIYERTA